MTLNSLAISYKSTLEREIIIRTKALSLVPARTWCPSDDQILRDNYSNRPKEMEDNANEKALRSNIDFCLIVVFVN